MSLRDRNLKEQTEVCEKSYDNIPRRMTTREKLELRKARINDQMEQLTHELEEIEGGLKLLNKNKELEMLANLLTL